MQLVLSVSGGANTSSGAASCVSRIASTLPQQRGSKLLPPTAARQQAAGTAVQPYARLMPHA